MSDIREDDAESDAEPLPLCTDECECVLIPD